MLATASLFDVIEADDSQRRVASRRALALAQTRLDNTLGSFLRGATSDEEFRARLAVCKDELVYHVAQASDEVGHDHPEKIANVLVDHYYKNRRWQPIAAIEIKPENKGKLHEDLGVPKDEKIPESKLEEAEHSDDPKERQRAQFAENAKKWHHGGVNMAPQPGIAGQQNIGIGGQPSQSCPQCNGPLGPDGSCPGCQGLAGAQSGQMAPYLGGTKWGEKIKKVDPSEMQDSGDGKPVLEPHQDDEDEEAKEIKWSSFRVAEDGNTDLDGPEPKIDKRLWTPESVGEPEVKDGLWPTKRKDVTEPIGPPNNEHPLTEHEADSTEHESLPNNKGDAGYDSGGPGPAPHTDSWNGTSGLADPVTSVPSSSMW